jgi:hypothetical protein
LGSKDVSTVILSFNQDGSLTEEETPLIHNLQILDSDEAQLISLKESIEPVLSLGVLETNRSNI